MEPIPRVELERTGRLLEMRASLAAKNAAYAASVGDRLERNTNKRQMATLEDEYANWDRRAQAQIERELVRRYQAGDTRAHFDGIEAQLSGNPASAPAAPVAQP